MEWCPTNRTSVKFQPQFHATPLAVDHLLARNVASLVVFANVLDGRRALSFALLEVRRLGQKKEMQDSISIID